MNRKTEFIIFFISLVAIGTVVFYGIAYFRAQNKPDSLLSDTVLTPQSQNSQINIPTIPTSTVIITPVSSSAATTTPIVLRLPYVQRAATMNEKYWPKAWGTVSFGADTLALIPEPATHGANSFLNGASSWANYTVNVDTSWLMGGWFNIVARVSNNTQNFVYCEFGLNGTEIMERVNGTDTQLAYAAASTTDVEGASENFGMKVYGNDVACIMANQEVVGAHVQENESPNGGIGFVIFGQPQDQKQVDLSNISVSALSRDSITAPFPVAAPASPVAIVAPPVQVAPPPPAATTTKTLPYSTNVFNASDWIDGWGGYSTTSNGLTVGSNAKDASGGIFLSGANTWTDYMFTAYVTWREGQLFELVARRTDGANLLECIFAKVNAPYMNVSIDMISDGKTTPLTQAVQLQDNAIYTSAVNFEVAMKVQGSNVSCIIENTAASTNIGIASSSVLMHGGIGFITWDPNPNNSQILVQRILVTPL